MKIGVVMFKKSFIVGIFWMSFAHAGNSFTSEFSHIVGGFATVLLIAYIVSKFFPLYKSRGIWIGFLVSMLYVTFDQSLDYLKDGKFFNQLLDFGSHLLGAILAVFAGRYIFKK